MAVKTYKKGVNTRLSTNFVSTEFDCHGKGCCGQTKIDDALIAYLQQIADHFGKRVLVRKHSGYRCPSHNKAVGGASHSKHMSGMAADFAVEGVTPAQVAKYAESIGVKGIGLYETAKDGFFVHIDTRKEKSFWYGKAHKHRDTFDGTPIKQKLVSYRVGPVSAGDAARIRSLAAEMQVPCAEL